MVKLTTTIHKIILFIKTTLRDSQEFEELTLLLLINTNEIFHLYKIENECEGKGLYSLQIELKNRRGGST